MLMIMLITNYNYNYNAIIYIIKLYNMYNLKFAHIL